MVGVEQWAEVRRLFNETAGELRGYLTVVPESRWIKHADHQNFFFSETLEHYDEHKADLIGMSGLLVKSTVIMKENLEEMNSRGVSQRWPVILLLGTLMIAGFAPQYFLSYLTPALQALLPLP